MTPALSRRVGWVCFALFLASVPFANWLIQHVGTVCVPQGPCLIPVAPGWGGAGAVMSPSGVLAVGAALVLRDVVQRCLGTVWGLAAVSFGTALSALIAPPALLVASSAAFLLSELADFAVYTPLQRRGLVLAVAASSLVGLAVDSVVFLALAFGSLEFLAGQVIGKAWAVLFSLPLIRWVRRVAPTPA